MARKENDYSQFMFICYVPEEWFSTDVLYQYEIRDIIQEKTNFIGWVSPLHYPDPEFEDEFKPHFHVLLKTDTRDTSLRKVSSSLKSLELNIAGGDKPHIENVYSSWANALLYLTHSTYQAKLDGKQQFDEKPLAVNQSSSTYAMQISDADYQGHVMELIAEFGLTNIRALNIMVMQMLPEYYSRFWVDLNKWNNLLYLSNQSEIDKD